jgi:hypothetical protein
MGQFKNPRLFCSRGSCQNALRSDATSAHGIAAYYSNDGQDSLYDIKNHDGKLSSHGNGVKSGFSLQQSTGSTEISKFTCAAAPDCLLRLPAQF